MPIFLWAESLCMQTKLIISVKEARKLLGKDARLFSDDQITELILIFSDLSNDILNDIIVPNNQ